MDRGTQMATLRDMLLAHAFEERAAEECNWGDIAGFLHLYPGEEAVAVGALHATVTEVYKRACDHPVVSEADAARCLGAPAERPATPEAL